MRLFLGVLLSVLTIASTATAQSTHKFVIQGVIPVECTMRSQTVALMGSGNGQWSGGIDYSCNSTHALNVTVDGAPAGTPVTIGNSTVHLDENGIASVYFSSPRHLGVEMTIHYTDAMEEAPSARASLTLL